MSDRWHQAAPLARGGLSRLGQARLSAGIMRALTCRHGLAKHALIRLSMTSYITYISTHHESMLPSPTSARCVPPPIMSIVPNRFAIGPCVHRGQVLFRFCHSCIGDSCILAIVERVQSASRHCRNLGSDRDGWAVVAEIATSSRPLAGGRASGSHSLYGSPVPGLSCT